MLNVAGNALDDTVELTFEMVTTAREVIADGRAELEALRRLRHVPLLLECLCQLASCGFKDLDRAIEELERGLNELETQTNSAALVSQSRYFERFAALTALRIG